MLNVYMTRFKQGFDHRKHFSKAKPATTEYLEKSKAMNQMIGKHLQS